MITVVDYGGGNLGSLIAALTRRGAAFEVTNEPEAVASATAAVLPGDGAFGATMNALVRGGLDEAIRHLIGRGRPFLGICVGMQLLYETSDEYGSSAGLGILPGAISRLRHAPRIPHMGWNALELLAEHPFVRGLQDNAYAYFLHSYCAPIDSCTLAATEHGERFAAIVARGNVMATQFHPEKSQATGALLLDNFIALVDAAMPNGARVAIPTTLPRAQSAEDA